MNLSGASKIINETIVKLEPKMEEMKNIIYPTILEIESHERRKELVNKMLTKEQQADYSSNGYSFLNEKQINILFDKNLFKEENERLTMLARLNKDELESRLEKQILDMVDSDVRKYNKREIQSGKEDNNEFKNGESNEHFTILRPFAFSNNIGDPGFLEASILSPNAFLLELLSPEAVMFNLLNPRAFVASILSPNAIFSRILQPGFFRAEILSPSAINSWVLSPDFFMAEVLSPKIMEARVLSPQYLFTEILSPGLLSPKVYSPDNAGLVVLSPFVLSPLIGSRESMLIQVLSPHILGGDINESHKEESPSDKSKRNDTLISY
uniref:Uncharacterized protein n=1 Tax=Parastrongyloides trichosuri TaxID=131310 RepID=A0A0N4ZLM5_PARTI